MIPRTFWFFTLGGAALLAVLGFFVWQQNVISKEILKLEILVDAEADAGEELTYTVKYKNNGNVRLQDPRLVFEFPPGSVPSGLEETRITQELDDIFPGQERTVQFAGRLFGKEGEVKEAVAQLSYKPKDLTARLSAETTAATSVVFVPLTFELDLPSKIEAGQEFDFSLNYFSNSAFPLSNMRVAVEYPEGFAFKEASPAPIGESEWDIGLLNRGEGGRITVTGNLEGELQEAKLFEATLGSWKEGEFTLFKEAVRGVEIAKPRLVISQTVNGREEYTASPGETLRYEVSYKNVSDKNLENLFLVVDLEGRPYDFESLNVSEGQARQSGRSILWEAKDVRSLRFLGQGEQGKVEFFVDVLEEWEQFSPKDANFTLTDRVLLSDAKEEYRVPVNSKLGIEQEARFSSDVFDNQGPAPPQVGTPTTYEVTWRAANFSNDVHNAKARAGLGPGVEMTGQTLPSDAKITYDTASRQVVWDAGDLEAGTGTLQEAKTVSFQIRFTPGAFQAGSVPQLIDEVRITADDTFTNQTLQAADEGADASLPHDDTVADGRVRQ